MHSHQYIFHLVCSWSIVRWSLRIYGWNRITIRNRKWMIYWVTYQQCHIQKPYNIIPRMKIIYMNNIHRKQIIWPFNYIVLLRFWMSKDARTEYNRDQDKNENGFHFTPYIHLIRSILFIVIWKISTLMFNDQRANLDWSTSKIRYHTIRDFCAHILVNLTIGVCVVFNWWAHTA